MSGQVSGLGAGVVEGVRQRPEQQGTAAAAGGGGVWGEEQKLIAS